MANITISNKSRASKINVTTTPKNRIVINNGSGGGGSSIDTIRELRDVDASNLDNNETLVFDETTQKFIVKELPNINGGTF